MSVLSSHWLLRSGPIPCQLHQQWYHTPTFWLPQLQLDSSLFCSQGQIHWVAAAHGVDVSQAPAFWQIDQYVIKVAYCEVVNLLEGKADSDGTLEDDVRWYKGRQWVPDSMDFRMMILQQECDSNVAGHMGQEKTIELVWRNFFWQLMDQWIEECVRSRHHSQKN